MEADKSSDDAAGNAKRSRRRSRRPRGKPQEWSLEQFQVEPVEGRTRFHDLDLPLSLMHAIADLGFEYCSPIQAEVLPHTLDGYDAVGKAQTGTGKTAAFLLAAMHELLVNPVEGERFLAEPRVVVLAPTRELVMQIGKDAIDLAKYTGLQVHTLVGGMDYGKQLERIRRKVVDIVAATPGRLIDFITRGDISLEHVEVLVLDEADRMLDMGFIPQVRRIVRATPQREQRQTMLFSATFNYDVNVMIDSWMVDPVRIEIEPETVAADSVDQRIYMMSSKEKFSVLKNIIAGEDVNSVIVFANRRDQTRRLYEKLRKAGVSCGMLSGEIAQQKRTRTLEQFKRGDIKVLVATDVAGRGIHIEDVSHVVNYNLPEDPEDYVHRIGRTGRAGAKGISISLACEDDAFMLPDIEALLGDKLVCEQPPASLLDR
ncbi:MAG: ATP-dependent RNA helicase RhlB [Pseudomonadales bacterium]|nr:ATP-dependent RNA helicase RhlB [Pseudomonadales bacterium]